MTGSPAARFLRFLLVGASSTGLYFLLLWTMRDRVADLVMLTAACYAISMLYNYLLQSWFTFRVGRLTGRGLRRFVLMHLGAMAVNSAAMALLVETLSAPLLASQVAVTAFVASLVFLASERWVYRGVLGV